LIKRFVIEIVIDIEIVIEIVIVIKKYFVFQSK